MKAEDGCRGCLMALGRHQPGAVLLIGCAAALVVGLVLWSLAPPIEASPPAFQVAAATAEMPLSPVAEPASVLSPVFTAEVRHWEREILGWAETYGLTPDLVATVMQIESCGNPQAVSTAGAQGLFQVMPFHFADGESMLDPATNARRGLGYLVQSLELTGGHVGMAFAGYNGGHVAAQGSWDSWPDETRRYYRWGSGIYQDAVSGLIDSPTLHDWLAAGGTSLCQQAAGALASGG